MKQHPWALQNPRVVLSRGQEGWDVYVLLCPLRDSWGGLNDTLELGPKADLDDGSGERSSHGRTPEQMFLASAI